LSWKDTHMQIETPYKMIPKRPTNIYLYTTRAVSWKYKKQTILTHSIMEFEKITLETTSQEES